MSEEKRRRFEYRLQVRSYELDSFGHVNNAVYLNYLEAARNDYLRQAGLRFEEFAAWKAFPVVRKVEMAYLSPLRADEEILIVAYMEPLRRTGFRSTYHVTETTTHRTVLEATIDLIFVDETGRPIAAPVPFRERFLK